MEIQFTDCNLKPILVYYKEIVPILQTIQLEMRLNNEKKNYKLVSKNNSCVVIKIYLTQCRRHFAWSNEINFIDCWINRTEPTVLYWRFSLYVRTYCQRNSILKIVTRAVQSIGFNSIDKNFPCEKSIIVEIDQTFFENFSFETKYSQMGSISSFRETFIYNFRLLV